ncbi:hypothetical protein FB45DRAFT_512395 [Roridomyces roridus]|uniref:Uncharacterized protein n=1 Tax=Roridomyces roridus TaxID=1738132 RepID=A0AAD7BY20_9AGAR|nr:hypothetical protein FB45DRAFT_512395 [Roridomyces roridus]
MAFWTTHPGNVFTRELGRNEESFFRDLQFSTGTADLHMHASISIHLPISSYDFQRAWLSVKALYPLLGATVDNESLPPKFVVQEERLRSVLPGEILRSSIPSADEARRMATALPNGPRKLSKNELARLTILSQSDDASRVHVVISIGHLITDGVGNASLLKEFLNFLATGETRTTHDLAARLSLAVAAESLVPSTRMSLPRQRWRHAAGSIISKIQDAKRTVNNTHMITICSTCTQGGQTLPRSFGPIATRQPARSAFFRTEFSPTESSDLIKSCRKHGITFGNALPVLAQAGFARLLCRRYVRGDISQQEWEFRKTQPYHSAGPQNIRPFLHKEWFEQGGRSNVTVNVGYFFFTLPYTPLGPATLAPGSAIPELGTLMSQPRFLLRCNMMKRQASRYLNHPLFFEVAAGRMEPRLERAREMAMKWEADPENYVLPTEVSKQNVSPIEQVNYGPINTHGWSTFGNIYNELARTYPYQSTEKSLIQLLKYQSFLHCRFGELYLASGTSEGRLYWFVMYDNNVYTADIIEEWVGEIKQATRFYLGNQVVPSKL